MIKSLFLQKYQLLKLTEIMKSTINMNILLYSSKSVYNSLSVGGAETSLKLIAEKFAANGFNTYYLSHLTNEKSNKTAFVENGVKVYLFNPIKWPTPGGMFFPNLKHSFIRYQLLRKIYGLVIKHNIDIVHTYNEYPNTFDVLETKKKFGLKFRTVIRIAGLFWKVAVERNPKLKKDITYVLNNVDAVNLLSESFHSLFLNELKKGNWEFNNNVILQDIGINNNIFNGDWNDAGSNETKLLMVARFSDYQKRQDILIRALSVMKTDRVKLTFVGTGERRKECESLVKELCLSNNVSFIDHVTQDELKEYYLNTHLNCLVTEFEGVPKSLLEAMSMGVPSVVSDVLPVNGYIVEGFNGYLAKNTPEDWANKIAEVIKNRSDLGNISSNSKKYVEENFNPDKNIKLYIENFKKIMEKS